MHGLGSPHVRDQLNARARRLNELPVSSSGEFVLYWMQSTPRLHDNWALWYAVREADRLARPLVILHELSPAHGSERVDGEVHRPTARHWHFLLDGAADLAAEADEAGVPYLFVLHPAGGDFAIGRVAGRACLVVTDDDPVGGTSRRATRLASLAGCAVVGVESSCIVPAGFFPREEYAPRTFRPKIAALLDEALEPVEQRGPRHAASEALVRSLLADVQRPALPVATLTRAERAAQVAAAAVDQAVAPVAAMRGGRLAAIERLQGFVSTGLAGYATRWTDPFDRAASSQLSPYLRWGQLGAATVAREVRAHGAPADVAAFLDGLIVSRELAFNTCLHAPAFTSLAPLPAWVHRSMALHDADPRPHQPTEAQLDAGETGLALWDAAQRELRTTGSLPQHLRLLWGKQLILMTPSYAAAHQALLRLNTRYALDGGDASGYAAALRCFGKYDRPFQARPVWGHIRPMLLARHTRTAAARSYLAGSVA